MELRALVDFITVSAGEHCTPPRDTLVVFTGGEPLLQLDAPLVDAIRARHPGWRVAVETNGTIAPKDGVKVDWICMSPKVPPERLLITTGQEIKVVYPAYNPQAYAAIADGFEHCYVSPEAVALDVGHSLTDATAMEAAAAFCLHNPRWRLSLQTHKLTGLP
ncbi:MAG: hypothetical protein GY825_06340 [Phycisphaeraceae bacterium]|nr:hypothetical protein [Phycisphaeraceae bacterium]